MKWDMSAVPTVTHRFRYSNKYFSSEAKMHAYRDYQNLARRVRQAGFPTTPEGIARFEAADKELRAIRQRENERIEAAKAERRLIRERLNLSETAHITLRLKAMSEEVTLDHMKRVDRVKATADQKLALIRELYSDKRNSLTDILIKTAQIAGVEREVLEGRR